MLTNAEMQGTTVAPKVAAASPVSAADPRVSSWSDSDSRVALIACRSAKERARGERWLRHSGFEVVAAGSGPEAAGALETITPDVVICDGALLKTRGADRLADLCDRAAGQEVPVLGVCSSDRDRAMFMEAGATDVLRKPVNWEVGARRAANLAETSHARRELARARSELENLQRRTRATLETQSTRDRMDRLTGIPNRESFLRILDSALARGNSSSSGAAVLFVDVDRFSRVNEAYGRRAGNYVLRELAGRLDACLERSDSIMGVAPGSATAAIGRPSGDEFTVMLSTVTDAAAAARFAEEVLHKMWQPFETPEAQVFISVSVGIAVSPKDGTRGEQLLMAAETAMSAAKKLGGGTYALFGQAEGSTAARSMLVENELRRALDLGQLHLHYQPLVAAEERSILGVEALLRWRHPELGDVSPGEFIPVAEDSGLIVPIGEWVLRTACRQLRSWLDQGLPDIRMAVNVSLVQLQRADLVALVREVLEECDLDPSLLELELSERGFLEDGPGSLDQLEALRRLGVRIALDDFGTGQSAIAYLRRLPLDVLKIDRSFVIGAASNHNDAAIASAMVAMGQRLQLDVVAEGVESEEHLDLLHEWGCQNTQGFLFSAPISAEAMGLMLAEGITTA